MPDSAQPSALAGTLRRPFLEQVAFFRRKLGNLVPTRRWDDILGAAHDSAFMVAGAQKADLLADLAAAVDRAIAEGTSLEAFRKDFGAAVARHDWHGWTGEGTKAGEAWRTRTIYRTNAAVAYAAGRYVQLVAAKWKYWIYLHGGSKDPRPEHLNIFNGLVLPPDHPFWAKFYPPSNWGCSCYVLGANTTAQARRLGGDPDRTLPDGWDAPDPTTGEPAGIGKGWGYAPGAAVAGDVAAMAEKLRGWDGPIGGAFLDELPREAADAITDAHRRLPSVADDARRYARRALGEGGDAVVQPSWTLGRVTAAQGEAIGRVAPDLALDGYDFSMRAEQLRAFDAGGALPARKAAGDVAAGDGAGAPRPGARPVLDGVDPVPARRTSRDVVAGDDAVAPRSGARSVLDSVDPAPARKASRDVAAAIEDFAHLPAIVSTPDRLEEAGRSPKGERLIRFSKAIAGAEYAATFAVQVEEETLALAGFATRVAEGEAGAVARAVAPIAAEAAPAVARTGGAAPASSAVTRRVRPAGPRGAALLGAWGLILANAAGSDEADASEPNANTVRLIVESPDQVDQLDGGELAYLKSIDGRRCVVTVATDAEARTLTVRRFTVDGEEQPL